MRMKEAQVAFHGGRLAHTTSLRLSLALLPAPLFQAFLRLKAHGGTLRRPPARVRARPTCLCQGKPELNGTRLSFLFADDPLTLKNEKGGANQMLMMSEMSIYF
jgi:hypothetical protein